MNRIGVLTSGGDAPGMNAAIRAVLCTGLHYGLDVVGIRNGFEGLVAGEMDHAETIIRGIALRDPRWRVLWDRLGPALRGPYDSP